MENSGIRFVCQQSANGIELSVCIFPIWNSWWEWEMCWNQFGNNVSKAKLADDAICHYCKNELHVLSFCNFC